MPRRSKRSLAAIQGWETRRKNQRRKERERKKQHAKRSTAAKKGWETRRAKQAAPAPGRPPIPTPGLTVTRRQYKRKGGRKGEKAVNIEIVTRGAFDPANLGNVVRVRVGKNTYSGRKDLAALSGLLQSSA